MNIKFSLGILTLLSMFVSTASAFPNAEKISTENVDVEIIEIIGRFSDRELKKLARYAELDLYEKYNHYNDDFDLEMICRPKAKLGSSIKTQKCESVFFKTEAQFQNQAMFLQDDKWRMDFQPSDKKVAMAVNKKRKKANAHMIALADKYPDLKLSLERYVKAKRIYEISQAIKD